jgi:signal transduction histidine kinase
MRLTIADTGLGMTPAVRRRMFESGFTTKARHGGAGLGLAIVREIATAHGARIEVATRPGRGTAVCVQFPRVRLRLVRT